ncbi:MAG: nucleotidyltransferase family protein [Oscillospiraceae bacterium]|nr:nucleotidyltransferase family protein [Oscillospiraceae bacterium]
MAVAGVIAEYNVFHLGHAWQLSEVRRRLGADTAAVVCMSGNFVQRGDFALFDKRARAETALRGGADLVLELPTPWASAAAERFAAGGVAVLAGTGVVTHLVFGCECGELAPLRQAADGLDDPRYHTELRRFLGEGMTFAAARQAALGVLIGDAARCLASPNNALAVEYLRALKDCGMIPVALPRSGAGHDSLEPGPYLSASAIRAKILSGMDWRLYVPQSTAEVLEREISQGRGPVTMAASERAVLARLRTMPEEAFFPYDGGNEGLYHRFYHAVRSAAGLDAVLAAAKTKRYPLARLRRMLLHSYLDVRTPAKGETPPCLRVLGANAAGRRLLSSMRKRALLPVLTKPGSVRRLDGDAKRVFEQESRYTDLYTLSYPELLPPGSEYRTGPVLL